MIRENVRIINREIITRLWAWSIVLHNNKILYQVKTKLQTFSNGHGLFVVHGATVIDASSSPSPPSTYSPLSSPSESRTSPNASGKHSSTKFSNSGISASSHGTSHHNDLTGTASASNRLNGTRIIRVCVFHF